MESTTVRIMDSLQASLQESQDICCVTLYVSLVVSRCETSVFALVVVIVVVGVLNVLCCVTTMSR